MRHLDLEVHEPGDMVATMSKEGRVSLWTINLDGELVRSDTRLWGNITGLTYESKLEEMDLTVRTYNCLKREAINTVGDLIQIWDTKGPDGLLDIRNFGQHSVDEVKEKLDMLRSVKE